MKKDNIELVDEVEVKVVEETTEVVEAKKSWLDKPKAFLQKHGNKVVTVAVGAGLVVAGYALGKQAGINSVDTYGDDYNDDETNDDYSSESNTSEF